MIGKKVSERKAVRIGMVKTAFFPPMNRVWSYDQTSFVRYLYQMFTYGKSSTFLFGRGSTPEEKRELLECLDLRDIRGHG